MHIAVHTEKVCLNLHRQIAELIDLIGFIADVLCANHGLKYLNNRVGDN